MINQTGYSRFRFTFFLSLLIVAFQLGFFGHIAYNRIRHTIDSEIIWSIGIATGPSPLNLTGISKSNPVLKPSDVTDIPATFVADPFMLKHDKTWHMFFEILDSRDRKGVIGHATSPDGRAWNYQRVVLSEKFHLSYPYVFKHQGDFYMIPESSAAYGVRLYKAERFPDRWQFVKTLVVGEFCDSSVFHYNKKWWMFTSDITRQDKSHVLRLFQSDQLTGPWKEHLESPLVVDNQRKSRSGGRVLVIGSVAIRFAQDCEGYYGNRVRAFKILELTPKRYREAEYIGPVLSGTRAWNSLGMHQFDPHPLPDGTWFACIDGQTSKPVYKSHLIAVIATFFHRMAERDI